ncbi:hypothetical protein Emed_002047 [Eimeria media]
MAAAAAAAVATASAAARAAAAVAAFGAAAVAAAAAAAVAADVEVCAGALKVGPLEKAATAVFRGPGSSAGGLLVFKGPPKQCCEVMGAPASIVQGQGQQQQRSGYAGRRALCALLLLDCELRRRRPTPTPLYNLLFPVYTPQQQHLSLSRTITSRCPHPTSASPRPPCGSQPAGPCLLLSASTSFTLDTILCFYFISLLMRKRLYAAPSCSSSSSSSSSSRIAGGRRRRGRRCVCPEAAVRTACCRLL